jgi:hypothetical protein
LRMLRRAGRAENTESEQSKPAKQARQAEASKQAAQRRGAATPYPFNGLTGQSNCKGKYCYSTIASPRPYTLHSNYGSTYCSTLPAADLSFSFCPSLPSPQSSTHHHHTLSFDFSLSDFHSYQRWSPRVSFVSLSSLLTTSQPATANSVLTKSLFTNNPNTPLCAKAQRHN